MAEYGDPDKPEDWAYIQTWSPYQLLKKDAKYPKAFFWTNTRDDRVHPGHARKMVAKMEDQGHPVYYFENIEGGHGSGAVNKQNAQVTALQYAYLWKMLRCIAPERRSPSPPSSGERLGVRGAHAPSRDPGSEDFSLVRVRPAGGLSAARVPLIPVSASTPARCARPAEPERP